MKKRLLAAALALCMLMSLLPTTALAAGDLKGQSDSVHAEDNGVVVNKTVTADGNGGYSLTMEAYVTNEVKQSSQTTPLDIVLVLDVSGSMEDQIGDAAVEYESTGNRSWTYGNIDHDRTTYYFQDDNGEYHEVDARSEGFFDPEYSIGYYTGSWPNRQWHQIGETGNGQNSTLWYGTLYTRQVSTTSKMDAMQSAVNSFISQVAGNAADAGNAATHRISIVKFADDSYADSIGNDRQDDFYAYNYTQIVKDFTAVSEAGVTELTGAINALEPAGATSVDYGLNLAQDVLDGQWTQSRNGPDLQGARSEAKKVVVVFTDGEPNHSSDFDGDVAATAVNLAKELKDGGVTVYTVGMFDDADPSNMERDFNKYMHGVSSNYPSATAVNWRGEASWNSLDLGTRATEGNYYLAADNAAALEDAFDTIASEMSKYNVTAGTSTVLSDTLSGNFAFPADVVSSLKGVTVQYAEVTGQTADGVYTWAEPEMLENVTPVVSGKTITVTGFDYSKNAVTKTTAANGSVSWTGGKLILTFPIQPDQNGEWTDAAEYPTNDTGDSKAGLSGFTVDKTPDQSLELNDSPEAPVETYSVIYDANDEGDAIGTVADGKHYIAGGTATVVSEKFSRPGYNFTGWNTAADGTGTSYEAGDSITIGDENVTLYAQWEPATAGYTVEHYWEKLGGGYELHENESGSGNIGETATAAPKTYTGFTYNPDAEGTAASGVIAAGDALVLKLYYDRNEYTVAYQYEGTVPEGAPAVPVQQTYKYGETVTVAKEPALAGHTFSGWHTTDADVDDGTFVVPADNVTFTGSFDGETYTVIYDLAGGTLAEEQQLTYEGLSLLDPTPSIASPTKEG